MQEKSHNQKQSLHMTASDNAHQSVNHDFISSQMLWTKH